MLAEGARRGTMRGGLADRRTLGGARQNGPNTGWSSGSSRPWSSNHLSTATSLATAQATPAAVRMRSQSSARRPARVAPMSPARASSLASRDSAVAKRWSSSHPGWPDGFGHGLPLRVAAGGHEQPAGPARIEPVEGVEAVLAPVGHGHGRSPVEEDQVVGQDVAGAGEHRGLQVLAPAGDLAGPQPEHQGGGRGQARPRVRVGVVHRRRCPGRPAGCRRRRGRWASSGRRPGGSGGRGSRRTPRTGRPAGD